MKQTTMIIFAIEASLKFSNEKIVKPCRTNVLTKLLAPEYREPATGNESPRNSRQHKATLSKK